jgi:Holliday junction resolvase RusA-like endonuclease
MQYAIKGDLAKLNEHDGANRTNRFAGAQLKARMTAIVASQLYGAPVIAGPCYIKFYWKYSSRHDFDNIRFACKYVLDGMIKAGVLDNDNQKWVLGFDGDYFEKVPKGEEGVTVEIRLADE